MVLIAGILPPTSNYKLVRLKRWEVWKFFHSGGFVERCKKLWFESAELQVYKFESYGWRSAGHRVVAETWDEGKVTVNALEFIISEDLIAEVSGLSKEGEIVCREKTNQGLLKLLVNFEKGRSMSPFVALKRSSGTLVSRPHLLLGPSSAAPISSAESFGSADDEDSPPSEDCGTSVGKKGISRKRKTTPQTLAVSLAKCSRRSARLQKKSVGKAKIVDYIASTEEEKTDKEVALKIQKEKEKVPDLAKENRDSAKVPQENQRVLKELRSHLKILNGLGGSLTGTCACINLLTLEIANYLKEVVSRLKELNTGNL
eukprot:Gb_20480 [translate_table: standard]